MNNIIWSIIISAYNNVNTINKCLESIISAMKNKDLFEIIIIDDCANDGTMEILKNNYEMYNFIKIIHKKENEGLFLSRLDGIKFASGKFCTFVDADDYIDIENWNKCLDIVKNKNMDITEFSFMYVYENGKKERLQKILPIKEILNATDYIVAILKGDIPTALWHRFYKRELLLNVISYIEKVCNPYKIFKNFNVDDRFLSPVIFSFAKTYYIEDINHYNYIIFSNTSLQKEIKFSLEKQKNLIFFEKKYYKILENLFKIKHLNKEYKYIKYREKIILLYQFKITIKMFLKRIMVDK